MTDPTPTHLDQLLERISALETRLEGQSSEIRTRRLVVVDKVGQERVVAETRDLAGSTLATVKVGTTDTFAALDAITGDLDGDVSAEVTVATGCDDPNGENVRFFNGKATPDGPILSMEGPRGVREFTEADTRQIGTRAPNDEAAAAESGTEKDLKSSLHEATDEQATWWDVASLPNEVVHTMGAMVEEALVLAPRVTRLVQHQNRLENKLVDGFQHGRPDADDARYIDRFYDYSGGNLVSQVLAHMACVIEQFNGGKGYELDGKDMTDLVTRFRSGPLADSLPIGTDHLIDQFVQEAASGAVSEAAVEDTNATAASLPRPTKRDAAVGERCDCGAPAVVVYLTDRFGEVPACRA